MTAYFGDTSLFIAYLNRVDEYHELAYQYMTRSSAPLVTTMWVLTELGNFLSATRNRHLFAPLVKRLRAERRITILAANNGLFDRGLGLYSHRRDKNWSMTDCMSFVAMKEQSITEALTADHHFEQAGFKILLK